MIPSNLNDEEAEAARAEIREARLEARLEAIQNLLDECTPSEVERVVGLCSRRIFIPNWFSELGQWNNDGTSRIQLDPNTAEEFRDWWASGEMYGEVEDLLAEDWLPRFFQERQQHDTQQTT